MAEGRGSGLPDSIGGGAQLGCGCSVCCNFGPIVFLLAPALPCPFLDSTCGINLSGWETDLGITLSTTVICFIHLCHLCVRYLVTTP